ncbi:hypothetical protein FHR56_003919 [Xanthomonas sacchari]|nr:hypothetical protein [Xanthomonas sp. F10]
MQADRSAVPLETTEMFVYEHGRFEMNFYRSKLRQILGVKSLMVQQDPH